MSDFFVSIGKRISDTVGDLGKKAGDTIDIQKKKNEIYGLKRDSEYALNASASSFSVFVP